MGATRNQAKRVDVDLIEVNTCYYADGEEGFTQIIFWDWCGEFRRFHVNDWCLDSALDEMPYEQGKLHTCVVTRGGERYQVWAKLYRRSYTSRKLDPERLNQKVLSCNLRRRIFVR